MPYESLSSTITINGMTLENRIVMAPAHEGLAHGGYCNSCIETATVGPGGYCKLEKEGGGNEAAKVDMGREKR